MNTSDEKKTIAIITYPGDEYMGLSSKLEEVDVYFFIFGRGPYKAQAKNSRNSVIIIQSEYYKGLPPYSVGVLMNEALESYINPGDTVLVPSVFEADKYRREIGVAIQKLLTRKNYSFNIIDYSVEGLQPAANYVKTNQTEIMEQAKEEYGCTITLSLRPREEFFKRHTVEQHGKD